MDAFLLMLCREVADYVTDAKGGKGVIREVVEELIRQWG